MFNEKKMDWAAFDCTNATCKWKCPNNSYVNAPNYLPNGLLD